MTDNFDPAEIAKFSQHAHQWWNPQGELHTLHAINPLRLKYINDRAPLKGKKVLDVGCGGGILAESMSKIGAEVKGIDLSEGALKTAKLHALGEAASFPDLKLDYELITVEDLAAKTPGTYDVVTCMEMLEHVPDPASIVSACAKLLKPGGQIFFSTLNRNLKSYLFAIVGAEYILKLLPKNTHDYAKFIKPSELAVWTRAAGIETRDMTGLHYDPFTKHFSLNSDISVNYLVHGTLI